MKIIHIANSRIPTEKAYGYTVTKMCSEFARAGNEVELWLPERKNPIKEDIFTFYKIAKNFSVVKIKTFDFVGNQIQYGLLTFILETANFLIKLLIKKIPGDAIYYTRNPEVAWILKLKGARVIYECHNWPSRTWLFKLFVNKADKIIVTTSYLKNLFIKAGFTEEKLLIAPDAVDLSIFDINISKEEARRKLNLPSEKRIIGYTGNFKTMGQEKGIKDILKAVAIIKIEMTDILFVAVGGSDQDINYYKNEAHNLAVEENIKLLPRVSLSELAIYQKAFDILLMPFPDTEHYRYYMSPLKMFEYMASGRPIIASDLPSVREVLNENNCLFVKAGDPDDLADKVKYMIADPAAVQALAKQAIKDVQGYAWQARAGKIIKFIF